MLALTRELVADLNRRARAHRVNHSPAAPEVRLADGNPASVGDVIITPMNDRRLRLTATDWVKNGDRWTITHIGRHSELTVRHDRSQLTVQLPADYVQASTGLGYATTIHGAQGISADTMHGLATGQESPQQLYTMLTRGRAANHLYLQVVGDGDPHTPIRPETVAPRTPTETLQQILARDAAPTSASTLLRELSDPAARLFEAVQRYTDGLHVAAEQLVGSQLVQMLNGQADRSSPNSRASRHGRRCGAHLLALAAETGEHPVLDLREPPPDENSTPQQTWPPCWTGACRSPHPPTQARCPGFPVFRRRLMIIPFGASIWRSGPSWLRTPPLMSEETLTRTARHRYGHRRAATRLPPSLVMSPSGVPPSASTRKTADQPEQGSYKPRPPFGNGTSTETLPCAATALAQT